MADSDNVTTTTTIQPANTVQAIDGTQEVNQVNNGTITREINQNTMEFDTIYQLNKPVQGYYTSLNAKSNSNSNSSVKPGKYYIYSYANGMYNISTNPNTKGWWVNPTEVPGKAPVSTNTNKGNGTNGGQVGTPPGWFIDPGSSFYTPGTSFNSATVFQKNPHYVAETKEGSMVFYITNLLTGTTVQFDSAPGDISDGYAADFSSEPIRGRSNPVQGYNSSGPRSLSFALHLYDDYCYYGIGSTVNFLRALTYPSYNQGMVSSPQALIRYGNIINVVALISSVSVDWPDTAPQRNGTKIEATVSLSMTQVTNNSYDVTQVEAGSDINDPSVSTTS